MRNGKKHHYRTIAYWLQLWLQNGYRNAGFFSLFSCRIFAIIRLLLVIWHVRPFSIGVTPFELSAKPLECAGSRFPAGHVAACGGGIDLPDPARDLSRHRRLFSGRSHGQAEPPSVPEPTAAHRLDRSCRHGADRRGLGKACAGGSQLLQASQAGHGHHGAGRACVQSAAGPVAAAGRTADVYPCADHRRYQRDAV